MDRFELAARIDALTCGIEEAEIPKHVKHGAQAFRAHPNRAGTRLDIADLVLSLLAAEREAGRKEGREEHAALVRQLAEALEPFAAIAVSISIYQPQDSRELSRVGEMKNASVADLRRAYQAIAAVPPELRPGKEAKT
jgi:hypothetical protein